MALGYKAIVPSSHTVIIGTFNGQHDLQVITSSMSAVGFVQLGSKTHAAIQALTPAVNPVTGLATGEEYYCSDCSTVSVCISTGTALGAWGLITNKGSACQ